MAKKTTSKKEMAKDMNACPACDCASCEECMCENCACEACAMACCGSCGPCRCPHHFAKPALIVLFGLAFLLNALGWLITTQALMYIWPSLVILYGIAKVAGNMCNCCGC